MVRRSAVNHCGDTGLGCSRRHLKAEVSKALGDEPGRALLHEGCLRVRVKVSPERDCLLPACAHLFSNVDAHVESGTSTENTFYHNAAAPRSPAHG